MLIYRELIMVSNSMYLQISTRKVVEHGIV